MAQQTTNDGLPYFSCDSCPADFSGPNKGDVKRAYDKHVASHETLGDEVASAPAQASASLDPGTAHGPQG